ncbi:MAG: iron ABC transporter permease [Turicibacter sp.]|nr:iron ABC transporter permease [Turicibacter sp.]
MAYNKKYALIGSSFFLLLFLTVALTTIGSVRITLPDVWQTFFHAENQVAHTIVQIIRFPRNLMAVLVGANLAVSGTLLQSVMKNPLADPGITGISTGASVVAIFIILVSPSLTRFLPLFAFLGSALACALVFSLAWKKGLQPLRVILAGIAVNTIFGGFISLLSLLYSDRIQSTLFWLNGSLASATWSQVQLLSIYSLVGLVASLFLIRPANVLRLGDEAAQNLGINLSRTRLLISIVSVFLAGITTAHVGIVGFVGLVVPHGGRLILGSDHRFLIPFSMVLGGLVLLVADTLGRTIGGSIEIPVGIITSLMGGPFFLYLLRKKG